MDEISVFDRIGRIFGLINSSTFFISLLIIVILTVAIVIVNHKVKIKIPRILAAIGYLIIIVFVIVKYGMAIWNVQDSFTDKVFSSFYFPNLITYICILLISFFVIIINFIDKTKTLIFKTISVISFGTILLLFVIILDTVKKNEIEVSSAKSIYENTDLMILIQASTAIFFIWMVIELIDYFSKKLSNRIDDNEKAKKPASNYKNYQTNTRIGDYSNSQGSKYINNYYNNKGYNYNYGYSNYYGIQRGNNTNYNYSNYGGNDYVDYNNSSSYNNYSYNQKKDYVNSNYNYDYSAYAKSNDNKKINNNSDEYKSVNYLEEKDEYKSVNYLDDSSDEYKSVNYLDSSSNDYI